MEKGIKKASFKRRVRYLSKKIGVNVKTLIVRPMDNKWASCSTQGNVSFSNELINLEKESGDYVILHELLHLKVPNHGKLWKSLMRVYFGDFEHIEAKLQIWCKK